MSFSKPFNVFEEDFGWKKFTAGELAAVEKVVVDIVHDVLQNEATRKKKRKRKSRSHPAYENSVWGQMLRDPELQLPGSRVARLFRRRFRVPYAVFKEILVPQCVAKNVFEYRGTSGVPIEIKIMIALRILGRDGVADDCTELSFVGESTCLEIFKKFVSNYSRHYYDSFVKIPEGDDLLKVMEVYRRLGFPGSFGSIDCTHIKWRMCGSKLKWKCTGKEGFPTLSFEAVVTHDRRCIHMSDAFFGAMSDITVSRNDDFVQKLMAGAMRDKFFVLFDEEGVPTLCDGIFIISDNGYLKDGIFACPMKNPTSRQQLLWSEWCESIRKDVECFFGILKSRFWFFKNGVRYHSPVVIQDAMKTAAILHNIFNHQSGYQLESNSAHEARDTTASSNFAFFLRLSACAEAVASS